MIKITTTATKQSTKKSAKDLVETLNAKQKAIAVAESCTGGLLAEQITEQEGASTVFEMGVVACSDRIKTQLLNVSFDTLMQHSEFSKETTREMAIGLAEKSKADYNIAITGIVGPGNNRSGKSVGTFYIAIATQEQVIYCEHYWLATSQTMNLREAIKLSAIEEAMQVMLKKLSTLETKNQMEFSHKTQDNTAIISGIVYKKLETGDCFTAPSIHKNGLDNENYKVLDVKNNIAHIENITKNTTICCGTLYDGENNKDQLICPYCNHTENKLEDYACVDIADWGGTQDHYCTNCNNIFIINAVNEEQVTTHVSTRKKYDEIDVKVKNTTSLL